MWECLSALLKKQRPRIARQSFTEEMIYKGNGSRFVIVSRIGHLPLSSGAPEMERDTLSGLVSPYNHQGLVPVPFLEAGSIKRTRRQTLRMRGSIGSKLNLSGSVTK